MNVTGFYLQRLKETLFDRQTKAFHLLFIGSIGCIEKRHFVDTPCLLLQRSGGTRVQNEARERRTFYFGQFTRVSSSIDHFFGQVLVSDHRFLGEEIRKVFVTEFEGDEVAQGNEFFRRILS